MAVYTVLDTNDIASILRKYDLGILHRFEAISSGIENTNYFLWLKSSDQVITQWVLTIFENLSENSLPFFNNLTAHLSQKGFAVPAPQRMNDGQFVFSTFQPSRQSAGKFGVLVPKFSGASIELPDEVACQEIATFTAKMHNALSDFSDASDSLHSFKWCVQLVSELSTSIPKEDLQLLNLALKRYRVYQTLIDKCPAGIIHGDLFRDNVLFEKGEISAVIDFYNAGKAALLFDLAVIANDWAVNFECLPALFSSKEGSTKGVDLQNVYDKQKLDVLLAAYQSVRPFTEIEKQVWPHLMELAAFRFYLSRLKTKYTEGYQQQAKAGEVIKSPDAMKIIMQASMMR